MSKLSFKKRWDVTELTKNKKIIIIIALSILFVGCISGFIIKKVVNKEPQVVKTEILPPIKTNEARPISQNTNFPPLPTSFSNNSLPFGSVPSASTGGGVNNNGQGEVNVSNFPKLPIPNIPGNIPKPNLPSGAGKGVQGAALAVNAILDDRIAILSDGTMVEAGSNTKWGAVSSVDANGVRVGDKYVALEHSLSSTDSISFQSQENNFAPPSMTEQQNIMPSVRKEEEKEPEKKEESKSDSIVTTEISVENKMNFGGSKK